MVNKSKKRSHYSPEIWITIRALYESGRFGSLTELHQHCTKIMLERCPSFDMLKRKSASQGWDKTAQNEKIEEKTKQNYLEMFSELGLTERKMAEVMVNGVLCAEKTQANIMKQFEEKGPALLTDPLQMAMMFDSVKMLFSDMRTAHKYLETCLRLSGANPSEKKTVTLKDPGDVLTKITRNYDEWSDDEINKEIDRLQTVKDVR